MRSVELNQCRIIVDQVLTSLHYANGAVRHFRVRNSRRLWGESLVDVRILSKIDVRTHVFHVV